MKDWIRSEEEGRVREIMKVFGLSKRMYFLRCRERRGGEFGGLFIIFIY